MSLKFALNMFGITLISVLASIVVLSLFGPKITWLCSIIPYCFLSAVIIFSDSCNTFGREKFNSLILLTPMLIPFIGLCILLMYILVYFTENRDKNNKNYKVI